MRTRKPTTVSARKVRAPGHPASRRSGQQRITLVTQDPSRQPMERDRGGERDDQRQHTQSGKGESSQPPPPGVQRERQRRGELVVGPESLSAHVPSEGLDRQDVVLLVAPRRVMKGDDRDDAEPGGAQRRREHGRMGASNDHRPRLHRVTVAASDGATLRSDGAAAPEGGDLVVLVAELPEDLLRVLATLGRGGSHRRRRPFQIDAVADQPDRAEHLAHDRSLDR
jgi:hypothetical protein